MNNNDNTLGGNSLNGPNTFERMSVLDTMLELINLIEIVGIENLRINEENPLKPIENKLIILKGLLEKGSTMEELYLLINIINLEIEKAKYQGIDVKHLTSQYKELPISKLEDLDNITDEGNEIVDFYLDKYREMVEKILPIMNKAKKIDNYRINIDNLINLSGITRLYSIKEEDREKTLIELLNKKDENEKNIISNKYKIKIESMLDDGGLTVLGALDLVIKTIYDKEEYFTN